MTSSIGGAATSTSSNPAEPRRSRTEANAAAAASARASSRSARGPAPSARRHTPIRRPRPSGGEPPAPSHSAARAASSRRARAAPAALVAGSARSVPASTESIAAASATVRAIGPAVSCSPLIGTMPVRLTSPRVGFTPTIPQLPAGDRIDPSVSVPTASGAIPAPTAAPDPELDPDGSRSSTCGFPVCPPTPDHPDVEEVDRKLLHSDRLVLPITTAPARRSRTTNGASTAGWAMPVSTRDPAVEGIVAVSTLSLSRTGTPSSTDRGRPARSRRSLARAASRARTSVVRTAPSCPSRAAIRVRQASSAASGSVAPAR